MYRHVPDLSSSSYGSSSSSDPSSSSTSSTQQTNTGLAAAAVDAKIAYPLKRAELDGLHMRSYVLDAMGMLLQSMPADPVAFLAQYFQEQRGQMSVVSAALRYINACDVHGLGFRASVFEAFEVLCSSPESPPKGITAFQCRLVLVKLCSPLLPASLAESVVQQAAIGKQDVVSFHKLVCCVETVLLFRELVGVLKMAFHENVDAEGLMPRATLLALVQQIRSGGQVQVLPSADAILKCLKVIDNDGEDTETESSSSATVTWDSFKEAMLELVSFSHDS
jgi:hypothetical protein